MNKKTYMLVILTAVCISLFLACPEGPTGEDEYDPIDPRLVGTWKSSTDENRTFTINVDETFTAHVDPVISGEQLGAGTVTGKLTRKGNDYYMLDMKETSGVEWGPTVKPITENQECQLTFATGNDDEFVFTCSGSNKVQIEQFFGGTYISME